MRKIITLLFLLSASVVLAADPPALECSAESLRFFPKDKVEQLIGPSQMIGMDKTACAYKSQSGYFNGTASRVEIIDVAFESFARANPGQVMSGRSCERYSTMSEGTGRGIIAQKDDYLIVIASSLEPQQNIDFAEYACAQIKDISGPSATNTGSITEETKTNGTNTPSIGFLIPLLIGILGVVAIALIIWHLAHKRGIAREAPPNNMSPTSPADENTPPAQPPTSSLLQ